MALTEEQIQKFREQYNIVPVNKTQESSGESLTGQSLIEKLRGNNLNEREQAIERGEAVSSKARFERTGKVEPTFAGQVVRGIAKPFARLGTNLLAARDVAMGKPYEEAVAPRKTAFLGAIRPVGARADKNMGRELLDTAGVGLDVGSNLIGGGAVANIGKAGIKGLVKQGLKSGFKQGTAAGAMQGFAQGAQEEAPSATDIAVSTGIGAGLGGGIGLVAGGASGALGKIPRTIQSRIARKKQIRELIETKGSNIPAGEGLPNSSISSEDVSSIARYKLRGDELLKDKDATRLIRGTKLDDADIKIIKGATDTDKAKFSEMLEMTKKASNDRLFTKRPTDVVGKTIVEYTDTIKKANREAGSQLDDVAKGLKNKSVDLIDTQRGFVDELQEAGVFFDENGVPDFDGSDFEGIPSAQKLIKDVYRRLVKVNDAYDAHRLKRYIDNQVEYGKSAEGIPGQSERLVKKLRAAVDAQLDLNFTNYDKVNTEYAQTLNLLNQVYDAFGKKFRMNDAKEIRAGQVARRILGNSANRGDIMNVLDVLEKEVASRTGKSEQSVVSQIIFTDLLEEIFGTQATTSLQGQVQRGVDEAGQIVQDAGQGQPISALAKLGGSIFRRLSKLEKDDLIESLEAIISEK